MTEVKHLEEFLTGCSADSEVFKLRPDYRAMLLVVDGLAPLAAEENKEAVSELVMAAQTHARSLLAASPVTELAHISAWRDAYRAFGAKPQRTRNSLEALMRRADKGMPRVNALTDIYNAISVIHQIPLGGEDFHSYEGPARLVRATGHEDFETSANGEPVTEHPASGEVVWRDDLGVTCRLWNWRQCRRTGLSNGTQTAFFILDALAPVSDEDLETATSHLLEALRLAGTELTWSKRDLRAA